VNQLPVTYSVICIDVLMNRVIPQFKIENPIHCQFWCQGLNDTYKVTTAKEIFILRVYRHNWRTRSEISFEIDALLHLQANGSDVAYPIKTQTGEYIADLIAPEGMRHAVLTRYADGSELNFSIPESAQIYAKHMAQLHLNSTQFNSLHQRFQLDVQHLITEPLQRIKPFLKERQDDWNFIENYAQLLAKKLQTALNHSPQLVLCHGDLHGGNAHKNSQLLVSFDFDCCALGLRSYDLAVFKWALEVDNKSPQIWENFLHYYQLHFPLPAEEIALIDTLVSIRHIWLIGLHIDIAVAKGWLNGKYFDQKIAFLRKQQLTTKG